MKPEDTQTGIPRLKRQLRAIVVDWVVRNWRVCLVALFSAITGAVGAYVAIWKQISDAKTTSQMSLQSSTATAGAVDKLNKRIDELVSERELSLVKDDVKELQDRLDYAQKHAGDPPGRHRQR